MNVSKLGNHTGEARTTRRGEHRSLASEIGRLGFAGMVRQGLSAAAPATQTSSAASSILATSQAAAVVTAQSPAAAATETAAAVSSPSPAAVVADAAASTARAAVAAQAAGPVVPPADAEHPPGTGLVTASGAPSIVPSTELSWDHRNYDGPAAYNPYYGTSASPTREGYVKGFDKWFQTITVGPPYNYVWAPAYSATQEGAQEALRIVQEYVPEAKIVDYRFVGQDGNQISHAIELPDGTRLNAGLLLDAYYHQGWGVDSNSDALVRQEVGWPAGAPAPPRAA